MTHQVLRAGADVVDHLAHSVATVALEVPHAIDIAVARILGGVFVGTLELASVGADDAHGLSRANGEVRDGCAMVGALLEILVPHALRIFGAATLVVVAEDTTFFADLSGIGVGGAGDGALGIVETRIRSGRVVGAGNTAEVLCSVPFTSWSAVAGSLVGLEVAGLNASILSERPEAGGILRAGNVVGSVLNGAGLGASLVSAPLAHDGLDASTLSGAEGASGATLDVTVVVEAARIGVASSGLRVFEFALDVTSSTGPRAHVVSEAAVHGSVTVASHLALGGSRGP